MTFICSIMRTYMNRVPSVSLKKSLQTNYRSKTFAGVLFLSTETQNPFSTTVFSTVIQCTVVHF